MTSKRTKVRIRRALCLLAIAIGAACAWCGGWLVVYNAVHGWCGIPQLAGALAVAALMAQVAGWLGA